MSNEQSTSKNEQDSNPTKNSTNPLKAVSISKPTPKIETFSLHNAGEMPEK